MSVDAKTRRGRGRGVVGRAASSVVTVLWPTQRLLWTREGGAYIGVWLVLLGLERWYREEDNYTLIEDGLYMGGAVEQPPRRVKAVVNLREVPDTTPINTLPATISPDGSAMFAAFGSMAALVPPAKDESPVRSSWLRTFVPFRSGRGTDR